MQLSKQKRNLLLISGFLLAGIAIFSLVLSFIGLNLSYLTWLNALGRGFAFVAKLVMLTIGFALLYIGATDWSKEEA